MNANPPADRLETHDALVPESANATVSAAPAKGTAGASEAPAESVKAGEAFRVYLELGPQRRLASVSRQCGVSLRTVRRWAADFDWRGRIQQHLAECVEDYTAEVKVLQRESFRDEAERRKAFQESQRAVAEGLLDVAQSFLERMQDVDLDQVSFSDVCKAVEVASHIGQLMSGRDRDDIPGPGDDLRQRFSTLLNQAYGQTETATPAA
jgi:ABC-type ATPase with predicted acetyltransferase domain